MTEISRKNADVLKQLYKDCNDTMVWSFFDDCFGRAFADDAGKPACAKIHTADFCFLAGNPDAPEARELIRHIPDGYNKEYIVYTPLSPGFDTLLKEVWGDRLQTWNRYAIKKEGDIFDRALLRQYAGSLNPAYEMKRIDAALYKQCLTHDQFEDFVSNFDGETDYLERGLGFVAVKDGEIAGGVSSYTVYGKGIEIEVDTDKAHRQKGIATACSAQIILHCLENGLYPGWDAANKTSVHLAEKLGYHFDYEYLVYALELGKVSS